MITNYFKIAWRNLLRNRAFSAINIVGLALGLASCMLISLYVLDELSFDRFNKNADRIVRVFFKGTMQGGQINESHVMPPVAAALKADFPEVENSARLRQVWFSSIDINQKRFGGEDVAFVDPSFFHVFTLPLLAGTTDALADPYTVVITEKTARAYFGNKDAVGKVLNFKGDDKPYKVVGVIENVPVNSQFRFNIFGSMAGVNDAKSDSWMTSEYFTYLLLRKGTDYKALQAKLPQAIDKYLSPQLKKAMGVTMAEFRKQGNDLGLYLQPLTDVHLRSDFAYDLGQHGDIKYVYIFGAVAIIMLIIACINFMNLSTAGASKRAREVGVRKVMGSQKSELVGQFLIESILITSISLILATLFGMLSLPLFNELSGKDLSLQLNNLPSLVPAILFFGLIVGVLAGSYPAFFLSSFKPVAVLKGRVTSDRNSIGLRNGLVIVQFFISITLMVGTMVVYKQLRYIQNKKLGYEKEQVLVLPDAWALGKNKEAFKEELARTEGVERVSMSGYLPAGPSYNNNYAVYPDDRATELVKTLRYDIDTDYIPALGMKMALGRNFSADYGTDSSVAIINETAAKMLGWKDKAIGHTITRSDNDGVKSTYRVIGIVKDFHFRSLHEKIAPLVMILGNDAGTMIVKANSKNISALVDKVKAQYDLFKPEVPFSYSFLNDRYNDTYKAEQKTGEILGVFAGLTILVACLGLFGLITFTAEQRTKEIGVRKVLGASVAGVVALLFKDFAKLLAVAFVLSIPVAYYGMDKWLQSFEYRVDVTVWIFILPGLLSFMIAISTIAFRSIKAALMNPVKSLRME